MIDLHSHILPGIDDGARTIEESLDIAREAAANGTTAIAATPHVREDYPTSAEAMEAALTALRAAVERAGIPIRVLGGGEIAFDQLALRSVEELRRFGLGGNPAYLLVETPYLGWPLGIEQSFERLRDAGITPVLAHPERNPIVQADSERVRSVVRAGALVQVTASSLDRKKSERSRACALALIESGAAHVVASDVHGRHVRRIGLEGVRDVLGDDALASWLTEAVPSAIVNGERIPLPPPRPQRRVRGRRGFPRFGR